MAKARGVNMHVAYTPAHVRGFAVFADCLAERASGDQCQLTGSGSTLEACSRRCAIQMAVFFTSLIHVTWSRATHTWIFISPVWTRLKRAVQSAMSWCGQWQRVCCAPRAITTLLLLASSWGARRRTKQRRAARPTQPLIRLVCRRGRVFGLNQWTAPGFLAINGVGRTDGRTDNAPWWTCSIHPPSVSSRATAADIFTGLRRGEEEDSFPALYLLQPDSRRRIRLTRGTQTWCWIWWTTGVNDHRLSATVDAAWIFRPTAFNTGEKSRLCRKHVLKFSIFNYLFPPTKL